MIPRVLEVEAVGDYKLWVRFSDGKCGTVDLSAELWGTMFEPLRDKDLFARASVHPELHTVIWPNGADLSPEYLYGAAQEAPVANAPHTSRR